MSKQVQVGVALLWVVLAAHDGWVGCDERNAVRTVLGMSSEADSAGEERFCLSTAVVELRTSLTGLVKGKLKKAHPGKLANLATALWLVSTGVRIAVLIDTMFPAPLGTDAAVLAQLVHQVSHEFFRGSISSPQVVEVGESAIFLVNRTRLNAKVQSALLSEGDESVFVDVSSLSLPSIVDPEVAWKNVKPWIWRLNDLLCQPCTSDVPHLLQISRQSFPHAGSLVTLTGWLLCYPVIYVFGPRLDGPSAPNSLSGNPLIVASLRACHAALPYAKIDVVSFSCPEAIFAANALVRVRVKSYLREIQHKLSANSFTPTVLFEVETQDHITF